MSLPQHDDGASRFGSHYHKLWHTCRFKHWLEQSAPHPLGGHGVHTKDTPPPLLIGRFLHTAIEQLRRNVVARGDWSLEEPLAKLDADVAKARERDEAGDHLTDDAAKAKALVVQYRDYWAPDGDCPEGRDVEVLCDEAGKPYIEAEFETPLPGGNYVWTCRVDMLAKWMGFAVCWEVKSVSGRGGWVWRLFDRAHWDLQMTGEVYTLRRNFPDLHLNGVVVDAIVKDRAQKGPSKLEPCYREQVDRTDAQLAAFERDVVKTLGEMERHYGEWRNATESGADPYQTAALVFPKTGMANGSCYSYNRACPFLEICLDPGREERIIRASYRARSPEEQRFRVRGDDVE